MGLPAAARKILVVRYFTGRRRWIELFFRWIKCHLRIKHYKGMIPNAVKTKIWIAILHKQLSLPGTLHRDSDEPKHMEKKPLQFRAVGDKNLA